MQGNAGRLAVRAKLQSCNDRISGFRGICLGNAPWGWGIMGRTCPAAAGKAYGSAGNFPSL
jgi:hypothetical protein